MNHVHSWKPLYRAGAIAALIFRRNIGAEVSLFIGMQAIPTTAADWYALLQANPFVGLSPCWPFSTCSITLWSE